jgi:hypothetical protein
MTKEFLIKVYKFFTIALVSLVAIAAVLMFVFLQDERSKEIAIGLFVGVILGGAIAIKFKIPKKFEDKDERTIIIALVSNMIAQTIFAMLAYLCFVFVSIDVIKINPNSSDFLYYSFAIGLITIITDRVSCVILDKKL